MNALLAIPLAARLVIVFCLGALVGRVLDGLARRLAWPGRDERSGAARAVQTRGRGRSPIEWLFGSAADATGSRARFIAVEVFTGGVAAGLYWWEVAQLSLLPALPLAVPPNVMPLWANVHAQYAAHLVLVALMIIASLVDLDEKIIPDAITVPGTLIGLIVAALYPWILLPVDVVAARGGGVELDFLRLTSGRVWPVALGGFPQAASLVLALGCYGGWCFALLPRRWVGRYGWRRAIAFFGARIARERFSRYVLAIGLAGAAGIVGVWFVGGVHWEGLLTSLVGMAAGGGIIWAVRLIGGSVLAREAMGFGDVTLLAMIGAFVGWQACLLIFFVAPVMGLVLGVAQMVINRDAEIPYGPFLCLAALAVIVLWSPIWERFGPLFALGWLVPLAMVLCLVAMGAMLGVWRLILSALGGRDARR